MTHTEYEEKKGAIIYDVIEKSSLEVIGNVAHAYVFRKIDARASEAIDNLFLELIGENETPKGTRMVGVPSTQRDGLRDNLRSIITGKE